MRDHFGPKSHNHSWMHCEEAMYFVNALVKSVVGRQWHRVNEVPCFFSISNNTTIIIIWRCDQRSAETGLVLMRWRAGGALATGDVAASC
eukprot:COSAG01_NODE_1348_length_10618_cov_34.156164_8_plen_90_part_00